MLVFNEHGFISLCKHHKAEVLYTMWGTRNKWGTRWFFQPWRFLKENEQNNIACKNNSLSSNCILILFIQWQVFPDVPVSHSWEHIQPQHPSTRVSLDLCGSLGGWTTLPSPYLTWRRPRLCIGTCWGPQWATRCPCPSTASTRCSWSSATPSWSCSILWARRARSLVSYRRTSLEGCTTFVLRWASDHMSHSVSTNPLKLSGMNKTLSLLLYLIAE